MNNFGKNIAVWVVISLVLVAIFNVFQGRSFFFRSLQRRVPDEFVGPFRIRSRRRTRSCRQGAAGVFGAPDRKAPDKYQEPCASQ